MKVAIPIPESQLSSTLYWLIQKRSITSIELRELTNSSYPPARIHELKRYYGVSIHAKVEYYENKEKGVKHNVCRYYLLNPLKEAVKIYKSLIA